MSLHTRATRCLAAVLTLAIAPSAVAQTRADVPAPRTPVRVMMLQTATTPAAPETAPVAAPDATANRAAWRRYLAAQREVQIQRLRDYATRGSFPVNRVRPGMLNVFMDEQGHLCAVANLMSLSGEQALVAQTARETNFIRLADVRSGALMEWMLRSGLTQEEIARIQEPYTFEEPEAPQEVSAAERARLQRHFRAVDGELRAATERSLDRAVARLGARADAPPPSAAQ